MVNSLRRTFPHYDIAATCSKALKRRTTMYATGPVIRGRTSMKVGQPSVSKQWSEVYVTIEGKRFKITVEEQM